MLGKEEMLQRNDLLRIMYQQLWLPVSLVLIALKKQST